jgi:hypothetical protein
LVYLSYAPYCIDSAQLQTTLANCPLRMTGTYEIIREKKTFIEILTKQQKIKIITYLCFIKDVM